MKKPLNQAIKTKISRQTLSDKQLADLQKRTKTSNTPPATWTMPRYKAAGLLATIFLTALFTALLLPRLDTPVKESMVQLIANEVVKNHLKLKPLEVHTNNIDGLRHYFTQLDFLLVQSNQVSSFADNLLGGRYCSIQSITAAQLRLKNRTNNQINTLYQTEYSKAVFGSLPDVGRGEQAEIAWAKGIKVKIWVEKGLLFAMTEVENKP